jgi:hypothetical protein
MRRSCSCVLVVAAMALFGCLALSGLEEPTESNSILRRFPGYHVLTLRELDSETRAFFVKQFPRNSPSAVHADFDGDGYLDYAVLVRNNKSGTTKLVILLCSGNGPCKTVYELDVSTHSGSVYIRPVPCGITRVPDGRNKYERSHVPGESSFNPDWVDIFRTS